jgi:hypothetical protein
MRGRASIRFRRLDLRGLGARTRFGSGLQFHSVRAWVPVLQGMVARAAVR